MKTHNASIYHCISCGRVVHAELKAKPPLCCGHTMTKAAAETIREGNAGEKAPSGGSEPAPPAGKGRTKPR
jgi:hypothetical protein